MPSGWYLCPVGPLSVARLWCLGGSGGVALSLGLVGACFSGGLVSLGLPAAGWPCLGASIGWWFFVVSFCAGPGCSLVSGLASGP